VGIAPSAPEGSRFLSGNIFIFEPKEKRYVKWQWSVIGYPLPNDAYRFEIIALDVPTKNKISTKLFTADALNIVIKQGDGGEGVTTPTEQIALFVINLLTAFAAKKKGLIKEDMTSPLISAQ
jgi:hypothetical protein